MKIKIENEKKKKKKKKKKKTKQSKTKNGKWNKLASVYQSCWVSLAGAIGIKNTHTSSGFEPDLMKSFFSFFLSFLSFFSVAWKIEKHETTKTRQKKGKEKRKKRTIHHAKNGLIALVDINSMTWKKTHLYLSFRNE